MRQTGPGGLGKRMEKAKEMESVESKRRYVSETLIGRLRSREGVLLRTYF